MRLLFALMLCFSACTPKEREIASELIHEAEVIDQEINKEADLLSEPIAPGPKSPQYSKEDCPGGF